MKKSSELFEGKIYFGLVFLCYLFLFIAIFPDVVFFGASFMKRDIFRYYYPVWKFGVQSIQQGIFPFWNPYNSYGTPFFADIQTCVFYPFQLLMYLPKFCWGFNFYILLHLALSGFFTCLWMRECGASRAASFLSGIAFSLSGYVMSAISLTISLCSIVYLPLVFLCLRRAFKRDDFLYRVLGSFTLLLQYLAGDPAVLFSTLFVCTVITAFKTIEASFIKKKLFLKYAVDFIFIVGFFVGLAAFQFFLFAEFLSLSNRATPTFDAMTLWSVQYNDLVSFVFPFFSDISLFFMDYWIRQSWLENLYLGVTVFILACFAWRLNKANIVGYHVLLVLLGVALALGRFCALYPVLYNWFPFFKFIRYPIRFVYVSHFAVACLAGFGLDALTSRADQNSSRIVSLSARKKFWLFGIIICSLMVLATVQLSDNIERDLYPKIYTWIQDWSHLEWSKWQVVDMVLPLLINMKRFCILTLFTATGIFVASHFKVRKAFLSCFFILLVFSDLVEANVVEIRVDGRLMDRAGQHMQTIMKDKSIFRALAAPSVAEFQMNPPAHFSGPKTMDSMMKSLLEALSANMLLPHRIFYYAGYDSLYTKEAFALNSKGKTIQNPAEYRYLNMLNVKYVVSMHDKLSPSYHNLGYIDPCYLYSNENVLDRAFLVPKTEVIPLNEKVLDLILSKDFDPKIQIYLNDPPEAVSGDLVSKNGSVNAADRVTITEYGQNHVRMKVESSKPQWLFFSDLFYPGWKATIDGNPVKIYKANYAFRAIQVPKGSYEVDWKYDPVLFKIGCLVSLLTLLFQIYLLARRRPQKP